MREKSIRAIAAFDQLQAGLRAGDETAILDARVILHQMTDEANAVQLAVLLLGPRCLAQQKAKTEAGDEG